MRNRKVIVELFFDSDLYLVWKALSDMEIM
jgi:hypothetical protein